MVINPRPFCGPAEVPGVAIARTFKLATHILVLLLKLLVYTEPVRSVVGLSLPSLPAPAKSNQLCSFFLTLLYNRALFVNLFLVVSDERPHCRLLELYKHSEQTDSLNEVNQEP